MYRKEKGRSDEKITESMIKERLEHLRTQMKREGIDAYIIPTGDFHETEFVCDYFACRRYMSGFTGSAGTLVVLADQAALWTDGRYFVQAAHQLEGSTIDLMKKGLDQTPTIEDYILKHLYRGQTVGLDGRVVNTKDAVTYRAAFSSNEIAMRTDVDLVGRVWTDRPPLPFTPTFHYEKQYAGMSIEEKLAIVRQAIVDHKACSHVITKIDEVAWLLNLRANDIPYFPVALAYMILTVDQAVIYMDGSRLDALSKALFAKNKVVVRPYDAIYTDVKDLQGPVLMDPASVNVRLWESIYAEIIEGSDPIIHLKAVKNDIEIKNTRKAHEKDGVALTRFMYWLKQTVRSGQISELSAQEKLHAFRSQQANYLEDSFAPITAYKEHAAMIHYQSSEVTDVPLEEEGLLMIDSGGQYLEGTTDVTRTYVLGPISNEQRKWFTLVLRGHIRLEMAHWLYGCSGIHLDVLARGPLWNENMDYQHGTGHGVGHVSSVHEGPHSIRWKEQSDAVIIEPGMITSDEPGVYVENKFGIRHENELLAVCGQKNEYGQFMHFECLTYVPFDVSGLDVSLMQEEEIDWLNAYHQSVFAKIGPHLPDEERAWLHDICSPVGT